MSEPVNPYATQNESIEPVREGVISAGQGTRFVNLIIDYIAQIAICFVLGVIVVMTSGQAGIDFLDRTPDILIGLPVFVCYYFIFEATTSRTLGKLVTGTKVVNEAGGKASLGQIAGRTFSRLIPFEPLSFFGTPTRGWHDKIPGTFVVKTR